MNLHARAAAVTHGPPISRHRDFIWARRQVRIHVLAGLFVLLCAGLPLGALAQHGADPPDPANPASEDHAPDSTIPPQQVQPRPVRPTGFPSDLGGDRPRITPDVLRPDTVPPNSGVEVGVGAPLVSIRSHELQFQQGPQLLFSDGSLLSADIVLNQLRFEYAKLLLRRTLDAGTTYRGTPINFIGIDADQLWTFYGWWPLYNLYIAGGVGIEYRLTRLSNSPTSGATSTTSNTTATPQTVKALTDSLTVWGILVNWAVSPPVTLKFRAFQEESIGVVNIGGSAIQIGFVVPF